MSHTPGPWYASKGPDKSIIYQDAKPKQDIAAVWRHENAKLIAAAPELLEALEEISSVIDESEGVVGWHLNGEVARWDEFDCVQKIMAAIKKARGEE